MCPEALQNVIRSNWSIKWEDVGDFARLHELMPIAFPMPAPVVKREDSVLSKATLYSPRPMSARRDQAREVQVQTVDYDEVESYDSGLRSEDWGALSEEDDYDEEEEEEEEE